MTIPRTTPPSWPRFAQEVIELATRQRDTRQVQPPTLESEPHGGVFVTLHKLGRLRGCMGTLDPTLPVAEAVRQAASNAATQDPRFPPVTPDELSHLTIEVSILSAAWPMDTLDDLQIGRHGIIVRRGAQRGLFLPQVATEHKLDKETFLARCCTEKAHLPADAWRDPDTEVLLFTAQIFRQE